MTFDFVLFVVVVVVEYTRVHDDVHDVVSTMTTIDHTFRFFFFSVEDLLVEIIERERENVYIYRSCNTDPISY
jgi:hypothetical protein